MTQITGALSAVNAAVQYSANGSTWTSDLSGAGNKVTVGDAARMSGAKYTFDGDVAIITTGKREPIEITFAFVYTEGASDAYKLLRDLHEAEDGTAIYMRWIPKGLTVGNFVNTVGPVKITNFKDPENDPESGDPLMFEITVLAPSITRSTYST